MSAYEVKADIDIVGSKSDKPRGFLLGGQSSIRCELVDDIGQLLAQSIQHIVARHPGKRCQCIDPVRPERAR